MNMEKMSGNSKKNLISLAIFLSIVFISTLLITEAINMFDLAAPGQSGGEEIGNESKAENNNESKGETNSNNNQNYQSNNDWEPYDDFGDSFEQWLERAQRRREEKKRDSLDRDHAFGDMPENGIKGNRGNNGIISGGGSIPEGGTIPKDIPNIDISGENALPDMPFGMQRPGHTIAMGDEKRPHVAAFEVLGKPNYPFLKVMAMDNYYNNRWFMTEEEPVEKFEFGVNMSRNYEENSVKIKPIEPSKGYMPVLSGNFNMIYDLSILEYKKSGTYYSKGMVEDFYEMEYEEPPSQIELIYAETDDDYSYEFSVDEYIDSIVDDLMANCSSDYDVIYAVEQYLLNNYILNNKIKNNYKDADGITEFLKYKKEGNYLDFISAYTFLLRAAGIPCRLAMGYRLLDDVPYQVVYADQVYIYPEIKFKDYGWVPMDPFTYEPFYTPPIETETDILFADDTARRGSQFTVKGTVKDIYGSPLDDMTVLIYVKEDKEQPCLSYAKARVVNGQYEVTSNVTADTNAGKYQLVAELLENDRYRTSSSDPELKVVTDTFIETDHRDNVWKDNFSLSGRILDSFSKNGVPGLEINISVGGVGIFDTVVSDENGYFTEEFNIKLPETLKPEKGFFFVSGYPLTYNVDFKGTDIYYPSGAEGNFFVWRVHWLRIVFTLIFLTAVAFAAYFLVKKRLLFFKGQVQTALETGGGSLAVTSDEDCEIFKETLKEGMCHIYYPQIAVGFPDVWGVEEALLIAFCDSEGNRGEFWANFHQKGDYKIKICRNEGVPVSKDIRIVVYREEIIDIGKSYLEGNYGIFPDISSVMTLREIHDKIKNRVAENKQWVLEGAFSILEKALYSNRDIVRDDYERFYVFINELQN